MKTEACDRSKKDSFIFTFNLILPERFVIDSQIYLLKAIFSV